MRLLYILTLYNPPNNHVKKIEFLDDEIKLVFFDDSERRFCFSRVSEGRRNIYDDISNQLDTTITVSSENNESDDNDVMRVKYEELCVLRSTLSMQSIEGNI
jgi:hypothetical protein